ncbi:MAG: radical SAM family heme chaperone HemW [Deltaproteobacteria bacterium]|nr:radical SAM family heme chaperone HemW [Deltaproteobacteria bacterium]
MTEPSSLYIHIPFCVSKCPYCSFVSWPGMDSLHQRYVAALLREAEWLRQNTSTQPLSTLFLGGGTPTILAGKELAAIVTACKGLFGFTHQAEISIEANPKTIDLEKLTLLRRSDINRLSIGVQSLQDKELQLLGRPHSADDAITAVRLARAAGFDNISLDLMYGTPGQDHKSWQQSLEQALSLAPDHLSLYELTVEQGTPYYQQLDQGLLDLPDEEELAAMDQITATLCRQAGLVQYEISNYARSGYECRHNINYWQNGPYLALGAGAVSCLEGRRQQKTSDPRLFCEQIESGQSVVQEEECLEPAASFRETVIMGLRMNQGVSKERLQRRYEMELNDCYGKTLIRRLVDQGLLEMTATHLRLTARGRIFANQVMAELV